MDIPPAQEAIKEACKLLDISYQDIETMWDVGRVVHRHIALSMVGGLLATFFLVLARSP